MNIHPTESEFIRLARQGNVIPVYGELLADLETPVSAFRKLNPAHAEDEKTINAVREIFYTMWDLKQREEAIKALPKIKLGFNVVIRGQKPSRFFQAVEKRGVSVFEELMHIDNAKVFYLP